MSDAHANQVELTEVDAATFEIILNFMYTNKLEVNYENVVQLFMAANFLVVEEIQDYCIQYLAVALTVSNFIPVQRMAEVTNSTKLLEITHRFFAKSFVQICHTVEFKELEQKDVVALMSRVREQISHEKMFIGIVDWVKHVLDERSSSFGDLFKLVNLNKMSPTFRQTKVATEFLDYISGIRNEVYLEYVELMELELNSTWQFLQVMSIAPSAAEKRRICIIGGVNTTNEVIVLDVKTRRFDEILRLPFAHEYGFAVGIGEGKILCGAGGKYDGPHTNQVHVITLTATGLECQALAAMNTERFYAGSVVVNDDVFVGGGRNLQGIVSSNEAYSISRNEWRVIPEWKTRRHGHALVARAGKILVVGGYVNNADLSSVECFDPEERKLTQVAPMNCARSFPAVVVIGDDFYAIGGRNKNKRLNTVEKYSNGEWSFVAPMIKPRSGAAACVVDGRIFVVGGTTDGRAVEKSVEVYDPFLNIWSIFLRTNKEYRAHSIVAI